MVHNASVRGDNGFTLAEVMVVLAIIAVLLVIAVASYVPASAAAAASACRHNQRVLEEAAARLSYTDRPDQLSDLTIVVSNWEKAHVCPKDGSPLAFEPATLDVSCPNHP